MTHFEILQEIQKMPTAEREAVIIQVGQMNLQDVIVEVTRHLKLLSPSQLLSCLNALSPLLKQDLTLLASSYAKSDKNTRLIKLIEASLKDYQAFKDKTLLDPEKYQSESQVLELVAKVEVNQRQVFFDTALMLLNPVLASLKEGLSGLEADRLSAVAACISLDDYLNDEELKDWADFVEPILEDYE